MEYIDIKSLSKHNDFILVFFNRRCQLNESYEIKAKTNKGGVSMSQSQGTFKRYEKKYLMNELKYKMIRQALEDKLKIDNYGKVTICNVYFDTPNYQLIRKSLEKPVYKEKLRLRSYGIPQEGNKVFVELKKKYKGIVYKRREEMELSVAEQYLYEKKPIMKQSQITKEIDWFIKFYKDVVPTMYISYNRIAMYGVENSELRVTFDSNILWRTEELRLEKGSWGNAILEEGWRLMEIKIPGTMPIWFTRILDELEIYPVAFSKYGVGYQLLKQQKNIQNVKGEIRYA